MLSRKTPPRIVIFCYLSLPGFYITALVVKKKPLIVYDLTEMDNIINVQCREERQEPHAERLPYHSREGETQAKGIRRGIAQASDRTLQAPGMGEAPRTAHSCHLRGARCSGKRRCDQGHYQAREPARFPRRRHAGPIGPGAHRD